MSKKTYPQFFAPDEVKIGAVRVRVELGQELRERQLRGEVMLLSQVIRLDPSHPRTQPTTLLHEIQHAIEDQIGADFDESETTRIAWAWAGVIADNPDLFRHLADVLGGVKT